MHSQGEKMSGATPGTEAQRERAAPTSDDASSQVTPDRSPLARIFALVASVSLRKALREIVIVTIGILIAFALNAWWEYHKERRQEQQNLRALASDFERNTQRLAEMSKVEDAIAKDSFDLLQISRSDDEKSLPQIRSLMSGVFSGGRFEPVMGAYDALVNSAGLTILRNDKLRGALASFSATVNSRYRERFGDDMYYSLVREFSGRLQFWTMVDKAEPSLAAYKQLLADPKFQDGLALRNLTESEMAAYYRGLKQRSEAILDLLHE